MTNTSRSAADRWSEAIGMVGATIGRTAGPDEVTVADIRRKLEVIGLDCPLHYDGSCARSFGYRDVVSPVSMTRVWAIEATWRPGEPRRGAVPARTLLPSADPPGGADTVLAAGISIDYAEPLHPGDRVSGAAVLRSVTPKTTRVGDGAFMEVETRYVNQDDRPVTVERATLFAFDRGQSNGSAPDGADAGQPGATTADGTADAGTADGGTADGFPAVAHVLRHEDVHPGDELTPSRLPLTLQRLIMEAAVNRDFSPWHVDPEVARIMGAPAPFANTTLVETLLEAGVRCWGGLGARIRRLDFAMRGNSCAGDLISVGGRVADVVHDEPEPHARLELWIDSPRGRTVEATALVALPPEGGST
jgi:acyl dehydratase